MSVLVKFPPTQRIANDVAITFPSNDILIEVGIRLAKKIQAQGDRTYGSAEIAELVVETIQQVLAIQDFKHAPKPGKSDLLMFISQVVYDVEFVDSSSDFRDTLITRVSETVHLDLLELSA